ncbi:hypothetical protein RintRC_6087 [Richelia intracellularis]|nr:hypothetical protein RintRC_6087 [Richelia intracellularis]
MFDIVPNRSEFGAFANYQIKFDYKKILLRVLAKLAATA